MREGVPDIDKWHYNDIATPHLGCSQVSPADHSYLKPTNKIFDVTCSLTSCCQMQNNPLRIRWKFTAGGGQGQRWYLSFYRSMPTPSNITSSRNCQPKPLYVASTFDFRITHTIIPMTYFPIQKYLKIEATIFPVSSQTGSGFELEVRDDGVWSLFLSYQLNRLFTVDKISPVSQSPN